MRTTKETGQPFQDMFPKLYGLIEDTLVLEKSGARTALSELLKRGYVLIPLNDFEQKTNVANLFQGDGQGPQPFYYLTIDGNPELTHKARMNGLNLEAITAGFNRATHEKTGVSAKLTLMLMPKR